MGVRIGAFELAGPLGKGGMGEVWHANHRPSGFPVALKFLSPGSQDQERRRAAFRNEVRAFARLRHPNIVTVLEYGEVDGSTERLSGGRFLAGTPWLAMELATGGSLDGFERGLPWPELRRFVLLLLEALGHAHARGVIHRDVKAANVLLAGPGDVRPGPKLTDFGIAWATGSEADPAQAAMVGTLQVMAPEQIAGLVRDFGPWTDLYAVGCLAYKLVAGRNPFSGRRGHALVKAHMTEAPDPLPTRADIPPAFAGWLMTCLAKDRFSRFTSAADAAFALERMGGAPRGAAVAVSFDPEAPTVQLDPAGLVPLPRLDDPAPAPLVAGGPPIPLDWRIADPPRPPNALVGVGLGLFGLRKVRLVGRSAERDALWAALRRAAAGHHEVVILRGGTGVGKSAVAEWLAERVHETGAAEVLLGVCGERDAPGTALSELVQRYFRSQGEPASDLKDRLEAWLEVHGGHEPGDVEALADLAAPGSPPLLQSAPERHAALSRFVDRLGARRPVVVWLDDAHWGGDLLGWVLRQDPARPVLHVLVVNDELLADRAVETAQLDALVAQGAVVLEVGALDAVQTHELIAEHLDLEQVLSARVEERSGGNPLFAVQLVREWVRRGDLELLPHGFGLRQGVTLQLPDDLFAVMRSAVDRTVAGLPGKARPLLWRAAILGREVDLTVWARISEDPGGQRVGMSLDGTRLRLELVDRLLSANLARETDDGFSFAHGMVRQALLREAEEAGVLPAYHADCAAYWSTVPDGPGRDERLGLHRLRAGRRVEALEPLLEAVRERERVAGWRSAMQAFALFMEALESSGLPESHPFWGKALTKRGDLLRVQGEVEEGKSWHRKALQWARRHKVTEIWTTALFMLSSDRSYAQYGNDPARLALLDEWRELADRSGDPDCRARLEYQLACQEPFGPDRVRRFEVALEALRIVEDRRGEAFCLRNLAMEASLQGDDDRSIALTDQALKIFESLGFRSNMAICYNGFGESWRRKGDPVRAEQEYRRALALYRMTGDVEAVYPELNLGILALEADNPAEAERWLESAQITAERMKREQIRVYAQAGLLAVAAWHQDHQRWDALMPSLVEIAGDIEPDPDSAPIALAAARQALAAGWTDEARWAADVAQSQYTKLGKPDGAALARQIIRQSLGGP